jgi:ABC-type glycerol-3-phosphate transport system permease component
MSEQLAACLIAVATNLVVMLGIYSVLTHLLARLAWQGRGVLAVVVAIVVAQLFWIAPAFLIAGAREPDHASSYALWFGNWLVCGFAVALLWRTAIRIPKQLEDSSHLDGLGSFATWRHVILPFVRRDLVLLALLTVMATLLPFWAFINLPDADRSIVLLQRSFSLQGRIIMMAAGSLIGALPLIAVLFFIRGRPTASPMSLEKITEPPPPLARG